MSRKGGNAAPRDLTSITCEVGEVRSLGLVKLQRTRERCKNCLRDTADVATLDTV